MRKQISQITELSNVKNIQDVRLDLIDALHRFKEIRLCARLKEGMLEFSYSEKVHDTTKTYMVVVKFSRPVRVDQHDFAELLVSLPVFRHLIENWFLEKLDAYPNKLKLSVSDDGDITINSHESN